MNRYCTAECEETIRQYSREFIQKLQILERKHINFHLGDEIMMERHGAVDGKAFVIGEKKYTKVIVPKNDMLFENTKELLDEYVKNGGIITSFEDIEDNDIIDVPEITYCQRHYPDFDMYYFVNSTESEYSAKIKYGNKVMDVTTGEVTDFCGEHTFKKFESLVIIDEHIDRAEAICKKKKNNISLDGEWDIVNISENSITLDYCDYYFNDILEEKDGYVLNAMSRAIGRKEDIKIRIEYKVNANYLPKQLYLVAETPQIFKFSINGTEIVQNKCGYFRDKSFEKLDISGFLKLGENLITAEVDFHQSEEVYENVEKGKIFESEKNKLTFDMEIEQMYLVGDFSVETKGEFVNLDKKASRYNGDFIIEKPKKKIVLKNIERQGFPFFAGEITVRKTFDRDKNTLDFSKCGINAVKVKVNGIEIKTLLWEPYSVNIEEYLKDGENEIELTLINNLRNLLGPFHLKEGETYFCAPPSFYKEECIWTGRDNSDNWDRGYCFVEVSLFNR